MSTPSNHDTVRDLLHEVTDAVEPGDRLDAIRAATAGSGRRTGRGWWAAGGVALIAASVVTALALATGGAPRSEQPDPAVPAPTTGTTGVEPEPLRPVAAVYYVGETPDGPRLYREFRPVVVDADADPLNAAVRAAVGRYGDGSPLPPLDPDYYVAWPEGTEATARVVPGEDRIEIDLSSSRGNDLSQPRWMTPEVASLSVEALLRTAQGVLGERLPVRLLLDGEIASTVLGVPTAEELAAGPDLEVLAHVSLSDPFEGQVVDNDAGLIVDGVANSFEGNVVITVETSDGDVLVEVPTIAGTYEDRLFPFTERLDISDVPAGEYVVRTRTDDPSGADRFHVDDRTITVVD